MRKQKRIYRCGKLLISLWYEDIKTKTFDAFDMIMAVSIGAIMALMMVAYW